MVAKSIFETEGFAALVERMRNGNMPVSLSCVADGARAYVAGILQETLQRNVLFVCRSDLAAKQLFAKYPLENGVYLPAQQTEIGIIETKSNAVLAARAAALVKMRSGKNVVFLSADALLYRMCAGGFFASAVNVRKGEEVAPQALIKRLLGMGYERVPLIEAQGQISGRGDILEVFPPDADSPFRITFFDDEVEAIKVFDEQTQRSFGAELDAVKIFPAHEFCLTSVQRRQMKRYLEAIEDSRRRPTAQRCAYEVEAYGYFPNIEAFTGIVEEARSIADYVDDAVIVTDSLTRMVEENERKAADRRAMLAAVLAEKGAFGCEADCFYDARVFFSGKEARIVDIEGLSTYSFGRKPVVFNMGMRNVQGFHGNFDMLKESLVARTKAGFRTYLFAGGRARALSSALREEDIYAPLLNFEEAPKEAICVYAASLPAGFELPAQKLLFLSEEDVFGTRRRAAKVKKRQSEDILAELKAGDIVVHEIHGKGRFLGIKNMTVGGVSADYIELEYRDGDKLYIQTAQIDRVQKYIGPNSDDADLRLSKLGSKEWENQKTKARKSIKKLAEDLQEIYLQRASMKGYAFSADSVWQREFEDNFEHEETDGQLESIRQIKRDMQSTRIMDRLLLGDVGYGKTEVAMRACFKAVLDSKQVAVLVPTTLLARQHYETFKERFSGFPVKIGMLSRFTEHTAKVKEEIKSGAIDIAIGTHKLLSKTVEFKDLGLLIVDEEQRFGVSHKERIKDMKRSVDVLTLTATPIPRTLEMALTGIRDMSTIDTPPPDRQEVQAYVAKFSTSLVREAVLKELARGGQTFFVCPRISQMDELYSMLKQVVPEARVCAVHGQLEEQEFERRVAQFIDHEYDLMLCTTIIESGIDIPAANTIIVYESDRFGLAQLYQLKGRVGRASLRAYAYFTHMGEDQLTEVAAKRLAALRDFTQFGSGLRVAMKDLEIRGAGNILGAEQSGHMAQIGYSLYCKLVRDEVAALNQTLPAQIETSVELGVNAFIPKTYIAEEAQKMDLYRRISAIKNLDGAKDVRAEFAERFGALPPEVENLLGVAVVKAYANRAMMASVIRNGETITLKFSENAPVDYAAIERILTRYSQTAKLRMSAPPVILCKFKGRAMYSDLLKLLNEIMKTVGLK